MKNRKRIWLILCGLFFVLAITGGAYKLYLQHNSDALWRIVSEQCMPNHALRQHPKPCLDVNIEHGYVRFKDRNGPYHDLLMPVDLIPGIESEVLEHAQTPNFMALAWQQRKHLIMTTGHAVPDDWFALAINSRRGRTQDHLHIHVACLRQDIHQSLSLQKHAVGFSWARLPMALNHQHYWARRLAARDLYEQNPFLLLKQLLDAQAAQPGDYGLAMVKLTDGDFLLLATDTNLWALDLGSTERIQDFNCLGAQASAVQSGA